MRSIFALVSLLATPAFANDVISLSEIPFTPLLFKICFRITALVASSGLSEKWVHFFGPVNGKTKVDSFIGYAAHLGLIRGGTPSGLYC